MKVLAWNMMLALCWMLLTGRFSVGNFLTGFVFGYLLLAFANRDSDTTRRYVRKVPVVIRFVGFFIWDLVRANLRVAYDIVTPTHLMRPAVVAIPLELQSDGAITLFANLISVTPGTLSLDVSSDRKVLYIHAMYMEDEDSLRREIKQLEARIRELTS